MTALLFFVRVRGESMLPKYVPGKRYLGTSLLSPRVGRVVLAKTASGRLVIKKIEKEEKGQFVLKGMLSWAASYTVGKKDILGVVF